MYLERYELILLLYFKAETCKLSSNRKKLIYVKTLNIKHENMNQ